MAGWRGWIGEIAGLEASGEDDLRPLLLVASALGMSVGGLTWGGFVAAMGGVGASVVPFGYAALTLVNIAVLRQTQSYRRFRTVQLLLTLLLPFLLQVALGGYAEGSAVVTWSLLAPLGAVLYTELEEARWWFAGFLGVLLLSAALEPVLPSPQLFSGAWATLFYVMNLAVPTLLTFGLVTFFVSEKNQALDLLAVEQAETRRLLLNVLPEQIADQLRDADEGEVLAEQFDSVSVLFADIVGFTRLTTQMSPEEMIRCLNQVFSHFDELAARYGAEKIRTIGDNYMVACGVPVRREDHAEALVGMGLDMLAFLEEGAYADRKLQFRIGINSGPAVAGVVGKTKFHYDLWGDAVNVASRMESHGEPGRIQIGERTAELLGDRFELEERGTIELKGKGCTRTWWVVGRRG